LSDTGTLGGTSSQADSINESGEISGVSNLAGDAADHAFVFSRGRMIDLGTLGGSNSSGFGLNNRGQVTGYSDIAGDVEAHAFLYSAGKMADLGTLGGSFSIGFQISNSGGVVGDSYTDGDAEDHAFVYRNGKMKDLGTLGGFFSSAHGINGCGQIVGTSETAGGDVHAFIVAEGVMHDLNDLLDAAAAADWVLVEADAINDIGQITGYGFSSNGLRGFVLTTAQPVTRGKCSSN
jgi:probable HAF family extracellular repeat protein